MLSQHLLAFEEELKSAEERMTEIANQRVRDVMAEQLPGVLNSKSILSLKKFRLRYAEIMDSETSAAIQEKIAELEGEFVASQEAERSKRLSATYQREVSGFIVQSRINNGLHAVCDAWNLRLIEFLLSDGYDPNTKFDSRFPLNALIDGSFTLEGIACLIEHWADVQLALRADPKFFRKTFGQPEIVSYLLQNGVVPAPGDLNVALEAEHWGSARLILEHGVDVNVRSKKGFRPLDLAILYGAEEGLFEKIYSMTNSPEESGFAAVVALDSKAFRKLFLGVPEVKIYPSQRFPYFSVSADKFFPTKWDREEFSEDRYTFDGLSEIITDWSLGQNDDGWRGKTVEFLKTIFEHPISNVLPNGRPDRRILAEFVQQMAYLGELELVELGIGYMAGATGEFDPDLVTSFDIFRLLISNGFSMRESEYSCPTKEVRSGFTRDVVHFGGAKTLAWLDVLPEYKYMFLDDLLHESPITVLNMLRSNMVEPSFFGRSLSGLVSNHPEYVPPEIRKARLDILYEALPKCSIKITWAEWRIAMRSWDSTLISLIAGRAGSWMDPTYLEDLSRLIDDHERFPEDELWIHFFRIFWKECVSEPRLLEMLQWHRKFWRSMLHGISDVTSVEKLWDASRWRNQVLWKEAASMLFDRPVFHNNWKTFSEEERITLANSPIIVRCQVIEEAQNHLQKDRRKYFQAECTKAEYAFIKSMFSLHNSHYECSWYVESDSTWDNVLLKGESLMSALEELHIGYGYPDARLECLWKYMNMQRLPCFAKNFEGRLFNMKDIRACIPQLM